MLTWDELLGDCVELLTLSLYQAGKVAVVSGNGHHTHFVSARWVRRADNSAYCRQATSN